MRRLLLIVLPLFVGTSGCYDGDELVARALRSVAHHQRTEIDLGRYQVTLPRQDNSPVATTLRLEVVATVDRKDLHDVRQQLEEVQTRMRHATLLALRQSDPAELLESDLATLSQRIEATTEEYLTAAPIESIAFRSFAVYQD